MVNQQQKSTNILILWSFILLTAAKSDKMRSKMVSKYVAYRKAMQNPLAINTLPRYS